MKTIFKPARIAFYVLMLLCFFVLGLYVASWMDAGKGQGLAGGAIVLGYGVLFAVIAFVASFFIAHVIPHTIIKISNWVLFALLLLISGLKYAEYQERDKLQDERNAPYQKENTTPTEVTEPISFLFD